MGTRNVFEALPHSASGSSASFPCAARRQAFKCVFRRNLVSSNHIFEIGPCLAKQHDCTAVRSLGPFNKQRESATKKYIGQCTQLNLGNADTLGTGKSARDLAVSSVLRFRVRCGLVVCHSLRIYPLSIIP